MNETSRRADFGDHVRTTLIDAIANAVANFCDALAKFHGRKKNPR